MQQADVAIVGAGAAGSLAATMLGRAGYATVVIDPSQQFGADFRCEKIEHTHADALRNAGVLEEIASSGRRYDGIWIARQGKLVEHRPSVEYGIDYADLVNALRRLISPDVRFLTDKVVGMRAEGTRQQLQLASGQQVSARLAIVATGLNPSLMENVGLTRTVTSRCHSVSIGFEVAPKDRERFPFEALTYFGEKPEHRVAYLTLFPIASRMRANLFVYRDMGDAWLRRFRDEPVAAMFECMPHLRQLTGEFTVTGAAKFRPTDLVETQGYVKPGIALVGDAFATACPTSGTGASKAFVDVERLCNVYVPRWLSGETVGAEAIAEFYADPVKIASDRHSREISLFAKRLALERGVQWDAYRWARCVGAMGRHAFNQGRGALFNPAQYKRAGLQWQQ